MHESLHTINMQGLSELRLPIEQPEDDEEQDIYRTVGGNCMIAWNSSKQIGAWIGMN